MPRYYQIFDALWKGQAGGLLQMCSHDRCYPVSSEAASVIADSFREGPGGLRASNHVVRLGRCIESREDDPTLARWCSFGITLNNLIVLKAS